MTLDKDKSELIEIYNKLKPLYKEKMLIDCKLILIEQKLRDPIEHIRSYNKWDNLNSVNNISYFRKKRRKSLSKSIKANSNSEVMGGGV